MARVLHVNHTAVVGGAERSLLTLLDHTESKRIAGVCCPPGPLEYEVKARGLPWFATREPEARFDSTLAERGGAAFRLARSGPTIESVSRSVGANVLHANSVRSALSATLTSRPLVTHVRDILPGGEAARVAKVLVAARSRTVVAISHFVAARFGEDIARTGPSAVVDNPIDLQQFPLANPARRPEARGRHGWNPTVPLATVIGQITPWKRQLLAIDTIAACRRRGTEMQLAVVGGVKFQDGRTGTANRAYERELRRRVTELEIDDLVFFTGERDDVSDVLASTDVVLVPSVDEPFGRAPAEALASGVPVIVSADGGPAEIVGRFGGGAVVSSDEPDAWADAISELVGGSQQDVLLRSAASAVRFAFDASIHARTMASIFERAAG